MAPPAGGTKEGCLVGGSTNEATLAIRITAVQAVGPDGSACGLGSRTETSLDWLVGHGFSFLRIMIGPELSSPEN